MSTFESIPPASPHVRTPWPTWPPARSPRSRVPATPLPATPLPASPGAQPVVQPAAEARGNPVTVTVQFTVYGEDAFATAAAVADRLRPIVRAAEPIRLDQAGYEPGRDAAGYRDGGYESGPYQNGPYQSGPVEAVAATVTDIAAAAAPLRILSAGYRAELDGTALALTRREYDLLLFLAEHPGQVFTRVQLLQTVWQQAFVSGQRTIDVHVRRLRAKLGDRGPLIATVRGVGYRLDFADRVTVIREPA
jgi:transcriptional regulator